MKTSQRLKWEILKNDSLKVGFYYLIKKTKNTNSSYLYCSVSFEIIEGLMHRCQNEKFIFLCLGRDTGCMPYTWLNCKDLIPLIERKSVNYIFQSVAHETSTGCVTYYSASKTSSLRALRDIGNKNYRFLILK